MNRSAIEKTAVITWSLEDQEYVVRSVLCPMVMGVGETQEEAFRLFHELLDDHMDELKKGRIKQATAGRPAKGKTRFDAQLDPDIKASLAALAKELGVSQGEAVEYLFTHYRASHAG